MLLININPKMAEFWLEGVAMTSPWSKIFFLIVTWRLWHCMQAERVQMLTDTFVMYWVNSWRCLKWSGEMNKDFKAAFFMFFSNLMYDTSFLRYKKWQSYFSSKLIVIVVVVVVVVIIVLPLMVQLSDFWCYNIYRISNDGV